MGVGSVCLAGWSDRRIFVGEMLGFVWRCVELCGIVCGFLCKRIHSWVWLMVIRFGGKLGGKCGKGGVLLWEVVLLVVDEVVLCLELLLRRQFSS